MGFGFVIFAAPFPGAGGVEVTQAGIAQAVNAIEPGEHLLDLEFGFAVGASGTSRRIFLDGYFVGLAIERAGGGEDEARYFVLEAGLEKGEGVGGVVTEVELGLEHGFANLGEGSKVHDRVESTRAE